MLFDLTILGCSGAIPAYNRHPSSHFLNYNGHGFLVDCGEGTQMQMAKFNIRRAKLDHVFISHLHGDHFFGLMGLISAFNLNYRQTPLHIYGNKAIEEIITTHFRATQAKMSYEIVFHHVNDKEPQLIFDSPYLSVETIPLIHRIPTTGFLFREKKGLRKILPEKVTQYGIPFSELVKIKQGADYIDDSGTVIPNRLLTAAPDEPLSYAYCSDTMYNEPMIEQLKDVSLLYHEATFSNEHAFRAKDTFHSTAREAATIAKLSNAKQLIIGHYSARYENLDVLLNEAREVFSATSLAEEGKNYPIQ